MNRTRPDLQIGKTPLKIVQEALQQQKPDIRTEEARDFVMNILKATGLAPLEDENIMPDVDRTVHQTVLESEKRQTFWKDSIRRMAERKQMDRYEPDIHS